MEYPAGLLFQGEVVSRCLLYTDNLKTKFEHMQSMSVSCVPLAQAGLAIEP